MNYDFNNQRSYNDFYSCNMTFWSNDKRRKYKDVEREGWNYFAKKAKTSEKSENISKAKIVLMFSQNSEFDCVEPFHFRKKDLLELAKARDKNWAYN